MMLIHQYRREIVSVAVGFAIGLSLTLMRGEWLPAGNGRIVHTRTGELRMVANGEDAKTFYDRQKMELQIAADEAEQSRKAGQRMPLNEFLGDPE
jgi:hypothetical protein